MPDPSLVLDLSMDSIVDGKVLDGTSNHNDGTLVGATHLPTLETGKINNCIDLDGTDDKITLAAAITSAARTFVAWIKMDQVATAKGDQQGLSNILYQHQANDFWYMQSTNCFFDPATAVQANVWTHIALVVPDKTDVSSGSRAYFNAVETNVSIQVGDMGLPNLTTLGFNNTYFTGKIDEVRVYDRALSAAEIRAIYDTGRRGHSNSVAALSKGVPTF